MMSRWVMWINLIVLVYEISQAEVVDDCRTDCACCASAPGGTRSLSDLCPSRDKYRCKYGCKDGYYATRSNLMCPEYCTRCGSEFGASWSNDYKKCYLCADGYYNGTGVTDCSTPCPINCANNICDKTTGHCLNGCTSNKWTGNKCDRCASGYYGGQCEPCPDYCKDDMCDVSDGSCTNGCKDSRFMGAKCDQCQTGKYGDNCDKSCPQNCRNDVCDRTEGTCTHGCIGTFDGSTCDDCSNGYYNQYCNTTCSSGCKNGACYRFNATCTQGCVSGYSGDKCCVTNNNCEICDTVSTCSKCKTGFYGKSCGQKCPGKCYGCDKLSGECTSCKIGYHGDTCNNTCPGNSVANKCDQDGGRCDYCIVGFRGPLCDLDCAQSCINDTCIQESGVCIYGCEEGYTEECNYNQEVADDNVNVGAILGGVVGGLSIVIIILVLYIIHLRCRLRGPNENNEAEQDNVAEMEEHNNYEGLGGETMTEKSVYSDLRSDVDYVNTTI